VTWNPEFPAVGDLAVQVIQQSDIGYVDHVVGMTQNFITQLTDAIGGIEFERES
jgi:hypothetical protein